MVIDHVAAIETIDRVDRTERLRFAYLDAQAAAIELVCTGSGRGSGGRGSVVVHGRGAAHSRTLSNGDVSTTSRSAPAPPEPSPERASPPGATGAEEAVAEEEEELPPTDRGVADGAAPPSADAAKDIADASPPSVMTHV